MKLNNEQTRNMRLVYQAALNNGLSDNQARALVAEVGRENGFNSKYIFGTHTDANNKKKNVGLISWQGERYDKLMGHLSKAGVLDKNGNIQRTQKAIDAQMGFLINEIRTNKAYEETKRKFLNNKNVDYRTAERVLGKNYIRWDYAGKSINANANHARRDGYYNLITKDTGKGDAIETLKEAANQVERPKKLRIANNAMPAQTRIPQYVKNVQNDDFTGSFNYKNASNNNNVTKLQEQHHSYLNTWLELNDNRKNDGIDFKNEPLSFNDDLFDEESKEYVFEDPYKHKIAEVFGGIPEPQTAIPDHMLKLARQIYDEA